MTGLEQKTKKYYNRDSVGVIIASGELFGKDDMPKNKRNVAIYARVSTEHEAQISALSNQIQYYDDILKKHPDWNLIDRYIDEGITGTSVNKRPNFLRMIEDAKQGKIDLIITREVTRFARNTVDTLQETRNLKKIGVEVWFIEDNIWTLNDEDGELRLTIMATLAQNESKKTSVRVKAGQKVSMENGVYFGNGNILGYVKNPITKEMEIEPEQAETVKMMFDMYLRGMGVTQIKYALEQKQRLTATGLTIWSTSTISRTLKNPFYCGTIVYRKEYVPDFLEQKKVKNYGEVDQIIVKGKHEALVSEDEFKEVQRMFEKKRVYQTVATKSGKRACAPPTDVWVKNGRCKCGHRLYRRNYGNRPGREKQYSYQCFETFRNGSKATRENKGLSITDTCVMPMVAKYKLETMAMLIFESLEIDKSNVMRLAEKMLRRNIVKDDKVDILAEKNKAILEIKKQEDRIDKLLDLYMDNMISKVEYLEKKVLEEKTLNDLKDKLLDFDADMEIYDSVNVEDRVKNLLENVNKKLKFDSYSIPDCIIDEFVDRIIFDENKFYWYLNVASKDAKKRYKEAAKEIREDRNYINAICSDDSDFDPKNYVYFTTIHITLDDVKRLMAHREEFKKANRFTECDAIVFI